MIYDIHHPPPCFPHPTGDMTHPVYAMKATAMKVTAMKTTTMPSNDGWHGTGNVQIDGHGNHQETGSINYDHGNVNVGGSVSNNGTFNGGNNPSVQIGGTISW